QAANPGGGIETGVADGPEPFTVSLRQAQQLTDDPERDRQSERFDQIDAGTGRLDNLELLINDLTDPRLQLTQPAHRELRRQEPTQPSVIGRISRPETADSIGAGSIRPAHQRPNIVTEPMMIRQNRTGLLIAGNQPHIRAQHSGKPGNRSLTPPPAKLGNRVQTIPPQRHRHRPASHPRQANLRQHHTRQLPSHPTPNNAYENHHEDPPEISRHIRESSNTETPVRIRNSTP